MRSSDAEFEESMVRQKLAVAKCFHNYMLTMYCSSYMYIFSNYVLFWLQPGEMTMFVPPFVPKLMTSANRLVRWSVPYYTRGLC